MHVGGVLHIIDYIDIIYIFINAPGFTKNISAAHDQNYVFQFLISESKTWSIDDNTINAGCPGNINISYQFISCQFTKIPNITASKSIK